MLDAAFVSGPIRANLDQQITPRTPEALSMWEDLVELPPGWAQKSFSVGLDRLYSYEGRFGKWIREPSRFGFSKWSGICQDNSKLLLIDRRDQERVEKKGAKKGPATSQDMSQRGGWSERLERSRRNGHSIPSGHFPETWEVH